MVKSSMRNVKFTHVTNIVIYIITTHGKEIVQIENLRV
jgi:hypothetical protein